MDGHPVEPEDLPAGAFSAWLHGMQRALRDEGTSDVPCDDCTACCTSSQFVHIAPDEADALAHIPAELLFPAPRMSSGHVLLGYDELGHCPMLRDGACSIYEHRPRTCRAYDCRIFPAAGLQPDQDKVLLARRAGHWRFDFPSQLDQSEHDAVRAAAAFVQEHGELFSEGSPPTSPTQLAVLAIELHDCFVGRGGATGRAAAVTPDVTVVRVALSRRRRSDPER